MNEIMKLMKNHRSIRGYSDRPIGEDLLVEIIRCGQAASSSSFIQACSVIRVADPENRKTIAKAAGNQRWVANATEFLVLCADMKRIQHCCQKAGFEDLEGYTEHFMAATIDTALMAQNMLLAAESLGLGGVFIGGIRNDPQTVAECLRLPDHVYPAFGMCLGWPDQVTDVKPRLPVEAVLHQDHYDEALVEEFVEQYDGQMADYYQNRNLNSKDTRWSEQTAQAVQGKKRAHMLSFLQKRGFLKH